MSAYLFAGLSADDDDFDIVHALHPAQPGTYVVRVWGDGEYAKSVVLLWGILLDASLAPICLNGPWHDIRDGKCFVQFPDGSCAGLWEQFKNFDDAVAKVCAEQSARL